jgi:hypothetical protein
MLALFRGGRGRFCFSFKHPGFVGVEFPRELFGAALVALTITVERDVRVLLPRACNRSTSSDAWRRVSWCSGNDRRSSDGDPRYVGTVQLSLGQ